MAFPYDLEELPPPADMPDVEDMPSRVGSSYTYWLGAAALIAGKSGYGDHPPDPGYQKWAWRVMRKWTWRELHKRRRRHFHWDIWNTVFGPKR